MYINSYQYILLDITMNKRKTVNHLCITSNSIILLYILYDSYVGILCIYVHISKVLKVILIYVKQIK